MSTWSRSLLVLTLVVLFGATWSLCAGRPTRATTSETDPSLGKLRTEIARFQRNPCDSGLEFVQGGERWYLTCEECGIVPAEWVFARSLLEVVEEQALNGRLGATELAQATAACRGVFP